jgi:heptaprenyl diphosphate synthase
MLARMAMMLAVIMVLSIVEHMLPPFPFLPPNVRLGLSNIVTMYTLFFMGRRYALVLAVLKSCFVMLMRGVTAGLLSISGGLLSIAIIILLTLIFSNKVSYLMLSVAGAVTHNFGQIIMASAILKTNLFTVFWPILLIAGILIGILTGTLLRVVMPAMHRVFSDKNKEKR